MARMEAPPSSLPQTNTPGQKDLPEILQLKAKGKARTPAERDRLLDLLVEAVFS